MRRPPVSILAIVALTLTLPVVSRAQQSAPSLRSSATAEASTRAALVAKPPTGLSRAAAAVPAVSRFLSLRRIGTVVGGTALGAGLGYFSSQVRMSDWDSRARSEEGHALRRRYAVRGALAGGTLGFVVPVGRGPIGTPIRNSNGLGNAMITLAELQKASGRNAYDVVQSLRPRWLVVKDVLSLGQAVGGAAAQAAGTEVTGDYAIIVYVNQAKVGGVDALKDVDLAPVRFIRFYNGPEATYKWGWGHAHGVIYVSTVDEVGTQ